MSNKRKRKSQNPRPQQRPERVLDFDAIAAKRATVKRDLPGIKIGGKVRPLPRKIPLAVTDFFAETAARQDGDSPDVKMLVDDMQTVLSMMFAAEWDDIRRHIGIEDVVPLFTEVFKVYGQSPGESSASGES